MSTALLTVLVTAIWDDEAKVWVATTDQMPWLATEAESLEALNAKLVVMVPDLLSANDVPVPANIAIKITAERTTHIVPLAA